MIYRNGPYLLTRHFVLDFSNDYRFYNLNYQSFYNSVLKKYTDIGAIHLDDFRVYIPAGVVITVISIHISTAKSDFTFAIHKKYNKDNKFRLSNTRIDSSNLENFHGKFVGEI